VEYCHVNLCQKWKSRAAQWALAQLGAEYNDIFSAECVNSKGKGAFYCCQLVDEAYKATNAERPGESPFPPHLLNFLDSNGQMIPYWIEYYR
jgi:hypothetical protein